MEEITNNIKTIIAAYYGVMKMDTYPLKAYVLKDINQLLEDYLQDKEDVDIKKIREEIQQNVSKKRKLQDALYILNQLDADKELIHLIKKELRKLDKEEE